ncbi:unnamed protein product, partial [Mesorhabditis spiculigera]
MGIVRRCGADMRPCVIRQSSASSPPSLCTPPRSGDVHGCFSLPNLTHLGDDQRGDGVDVENLVETPTIPEQTCFHCSAPTTQGPLYGVILCPSCQKKAGPWARSAKPCCQQMKGCADLAVYVDDIGFAEAELEAYTRILEILRGRSCWYCQIVATPLARAVTDWKGKQEPGKTRGARKAAAPAATTIIGMLLVFMLLGISTATSSTTTYDELERGDLYGFNQYKSQLFANQFEYDAVHLLGVVERYQQKWKHADQLANDLDDKCQQHQDAAFAKDERIRKLEAELKDARAQLAAQLSESNALKLDLKNLEAKFKLVQKSRPRR